MFRCVTTALVAFVLCTAAAAQSQRNFPPTALRGALMVLDPAQVLLNGQPAQLGAGARIRGDDNLLKMSGSLIGSKFLVHYTLDTQGLIRDVWILTPQEAANRPWPSTPLQASRWTFDPVAQVWTKP